jgi:hypothetical protein
MGVENGNRLARAAPDCGDVSVSNELASDSVLKKAFIWLRNEGIRERTVRSEVGVEIICGLSVERGRWMK